MRMLQGQQRSAALGCALSFFDFRKVPPPPPQLQPLQTLSHATQVEFGCVGLFSGFIFALPSFRNSMPLAPPFGSLSDWISFFWAEGFAIIGVCLLAVKFVHTTPLNLQPSCSIDHLQVPIRAAPIQKQRRQVAHGRFLRPPSTQGHYSCPRACALSSQPRTAGGGTPEQRISPPMRAFFVQCNIMYTSIHVL